MSTKKTTQVKESSGMGAGAMAGSPSLKDEKTPLEEVTMNSQWFMKGVQDGEVERKKNAKALSGRLGHSIQVSYEKGYKQGLMKKLDIRNPSIKFEGEKKMKKVTRESLEGLVRAIIKEQYEDLRMPTDVGTHVEPAPAEPEDPTAKLERVIQTMEVEGGDSRVYLDDLKDALNSMPTSAIAEEKS